MKKENSEKKVFKYLRSEQELHKGYTIIFIWINHLAIPNETYYEAIAFVWGPTGMKYVAATEIDDLDAFKESAKEELVKAIDQDDKKVITVKGLYVPRGISRKDKGTN